MQRALAEGLKACCLPPFEAKVAQEQIVMLREPLEYLSSCKYCSSLASQSLRVAWNSFRVEERVEGTRVSTLGRCKEPRIVQHFLTQ